MPGRQLIPRPPGVQSGGPPPWSALSARALTLADVRDRIDERFARATGQGEIASGSIDARMLDTERSVIDREYPLSEAPEALSYLGEGHARGKVVITV